MGKKISQFIICLSVLTILSACRLSANFYEIDKGKFYRSAQLTPEELELAIEKVAIKTVINLRGASPGSDWFDDEKAVLDKHGVAHINIRMSAKRLPHKKDLQALIEAYETAERPLLVHCKAGADRAGEASAIYLMDYMGKSRAKALKMLTPKFYHFAAFMPAKRYFIRKYEGADWAKNEYDPCKDKYNYYDQEKYCTGTYSEEEALEVDDDT